MIKILKLMILIVKVCKVVHSIKYYKVIEYIYIYTHIGFVVQIILFGCYCLHEFVVELRVEAVYSYIDISEQVLCTC